MFLKEISATIKNTNANANANALKHRAHETQ